MKQGYLFLATVFIVLSHTTSSGQTSSIQVDTSLNWQQWISTILGGNCVQISNVTFSNQPGSASRFSNGSFIGLNEGIVLSTGTLGPEINSDPSTFLAGTFPGLSTDTLLEQYAIVDLGLGGGTYPSFDATRLEFDFTPSEDQQVTIRFVFASEEYPDYAPPIISDFNDIFAFLVSEAGSSNFQNIALIPGTSLPVTISNVNAITNTPYYIETGATDSFAFNGYTTPITATFQATAGITYHLVIAIADISDNVFDSAVFLEKQTNGNQTVQGSVNVISGPVDQGYTELFGYSLEPGAFPRIDSVAISAGTFAFSNVEYGLYLIRSVPDSLLYPLAVPTYYGGSILWEQAQPVSLSCNDYVVSAASLVINNGLGFISGQVGADAQGFRLRSGDLIPAPGIQVFLQDSATSEVRGFMRTDETGSYHFDELALGTYYVMPDVAGVPLLDYRKVVLSQDTMGYDNISFQLTPDGVIDIDNLGITPQLIELGEMVEWTVTASNYYGPGINNRIRTGGDTLINDTLYHTLWVDGIFGAADEFNPDEQELLGGFRQLGSKLFVRLMYDFGGAPVELLDQDVFYFDFQFEPGDTFHFPSPGGMLEMTIIGRDTFLLNGIARTRWTFQNIQSAETENFVMGVGNSNGFFNIGSPTIPDAQYMRNICWTDGLGNTSFYQDMYNVESWNLTSCYLQTGGFENHDTARFELYPNPGNAIVTMKLNKAEQGLLTIRDLSGRLHYQTTINSQQHSINLSKLGSGMYILEFRNEQGEGSFARWIKD